MCTVSWSCIQALCGPAVAATSNELCKDNSKLLQGHDHVAYAYPHQMIKRTSMSSGGMSDKSLEMCTENLGCENGSDMILTDSTGVFFEDHVEQTPRRRTRMNNLNSRGSAICFPPPLSTISGSNSIRISCRRESGRLVMDACSAPPRHSYIQAERSGGRLRLSLIMRDNESDCDDGATEDGEHDGDQLEEEEENEEYPREDDVIMNYWGRAEQIEIEEEAAAEEQGGDKEEENMEEEEVALEGEYDHETDKMCIMRGMNGIRWKIGGNMGSRCKEIGGGRSNRDRIFINWESFWVATS